MKKIGVQQRIIFLMAVFAALLILSLLFNGCTTKKVTEISKYESIERSDTAITYQKDSIFIKIVETIKDTTFLIKPDSATIKALIYCDSLGNAHIKEITELRAGQRVKQDIKLENNVLTTTATIDSAAIYFQYKNTHAQEFKQEKIKEINKSQEKQENSSDTNIKKTVYKLPWWIWGLIIVGVGFVVVKWVLPIFWPWLKLL